MKHIFTILTLWMSLNGLIHSATIAPESVVIVYNSNIPESKELAEYYALSRFIPTENLVGINVSEKESISRSSYNKTIKKPLKEIFNDKKWWSLSKDPHGVIKPNYSKIKVIVCMRGVPYKIQRTPRPKGADGKAQKIPTGTQDEASVDSELALLGVEGIPTKGLVNNPYYKSQSTFAKASLPQMLLVGRIDGPSYAICKSMIKDALATESRGLWGMCYLDLALKGGNYKVGDDWLESIAKQNHTLGIPTVVDRNKQTYTTNYPMNDAALYFGWYQRTRNGALLNPKFKFRQGAIAVHLHSFSAASLRSSKKNWCGPILAKGAAATLGNVYEPYLAPTHNFAIFYDRLIKGHTLVEAAYMSLPGLSWQQVVVGDPLYRPFIHIRGGGVKHYKDSNYRAIQVANSLWGKQPTELVAKLRTAADKKNKAKFYEYLGLWHRENNYTEQANDYFKLSAKTFLEESDRLRQWLLIADNQRSSGNKKAAIKTLRETDALIADIPEKLALKALLNILDPPPPPPASTEKAQ